MRVCVLHALDSMRKISSVHLYVFSGKEGGNKREKKLSHSPSPPPPPPPPSPTLLRLLFSVLPWLWLGRDCSDKFNRGRGWGGAGGCRQERKKKTPSARLFSPHSVMEMRFSISLHLKYLNTSLLRIALPCLLTHFLPHKCSVVASAAAAAAADADAEPGMNFELLCLHREIRFPTNRVKCELSY